MTLWGQDFFENKNNIFEWKSQLTGKRVSSDFFVFWLDCFRLKQNIHFWDKNLESATKSIV